MKAVVQLRSRMAADQSEKLKGQPCTESEVAVLLHENADVYKPSGEVLCMLRRRCIGEAAMERAYPSLHALKRYTTDNRGVYAGRPRVPRESSDGVALKNTRTMDEHGKILQVQSAIVGYYDRQGGRHPYCRATAFTGNEVEKWNQVLPMVGEAAALFKSEAPQRYEAQLKMAQRANPAYVIPGTPFTTLTVNNNVVAATHKDAGDYKDGLGLISVVRRGTYRGAWLTFPEYGVGVDLGHGDAVFFNSHDWHGVTPFHDEEEGHERISVVYYFRERMVDCGSPEEELRRARRTGGGKL